MCMIDDADPWDVYRDEWRRAAKSYRCDECLRTIDKGERYQFATGLLWGTWDTFHACEQCVEARRWLEVVCNGWLWHATVDDLANHVTGDESYLRTAPLTRIVRWQSARWRDRNGNLRPVETVRPVVDRAIVLARRQNIAA